MILPLVPTLVLVLAAVVGLVLVLLLGLVLVLVVLLVVLSLVPPLPALLPPAAKRHPDLHLLPAPPAVALSPVTTLLTPVLPPLLITPLLPMVVCPQQPLLQLRLVVQLVTIVV